MGYGFQGQGQTTTLETFGSPETRMNRAQVLSAFDRLISGALSRSSTLFGGGVLPSGWMLFNSYPGP